MKKVLAIILAAMLFMTALPLGAFSLTVGAAEAAPTVRVESVGGYAGDTVNVTVYMENNPGIIAWAVWLNVNETIFEVPLKKNGTPNVTNGIFYGVVYGPNKAPYSTIKGTWQDGAAEEDNTSNGVLFTLPLVIKEDAPAGVYDLTLSGPAKNAFLNYDYDAVDFDLVDGTIEVYERVTGVELGVDTLDMKNGDTHALAPVFTPANAYNKAVTYTVEDESVATVSPDGVITAVKRGSTTVTVTTEDGGYTDSVLVNVSCADLEYNAAVEPDHFHGGNIAYWYCANCGGYFTDADGLNEVTYNDTQLSIIPHDHSDTWSFDENGHWHECVCGDRIDEGEHIYDNACDAECICGYVREVPPHVYDGLTDGYCNECGATRVVTQFDLTTPYTRVYTLNVGVLDVFGGYVDIAYEDGAAGRVELTTDMVSGFDNSVLGFQTLTVTVGSGSTEYLVQVLDTEDLPTIRVVPDGEKAYLGTTFTALVCLENNPGLVSMKLALSYDTTKLELISAEGADFADVAFGPTGNVPFSVNWVDALHPDNTTNGAVVKLTFQVKADAAVGPTPITVNYDTDNLFNFDMDTVLFNCAYGQVEIIDYISGDVDRDGEVGLKDLTTLQRYLSGWDVTIDEMAADVDRDGEVGLKDLTTLQRYLSGWDVELK